MAADAHSTRCERPDFRQERNGRHLLVWGRLGQWLVVDSSTAGLMDSLFAAESVADGLRCHVRAAGGPVERLAREAQPVINELTARGIAAGPGARVVSPEEPLHIANLTFNITNRCNLRCPWCYNPRSAGGEVGADMFIRWLRDGAPSLPRDAALTILGGEPFLDEERLLTTARGAREILQGEILVSTNGTLLGDETPRALAATGTTVQISLDSASALRHDAMRGPGVYDKAVANAQRLVEAGVRTILSMVLTGENQHEFEAYFDLAGRIGVDEVRFIPLRRLGGGARFAAQVPDLLNSFHQLLTLLRRRPELAGRMQRDFFSILMTVCRFSRLRDNCGIGRRCLFVDADGVIYPCPNHRGGRYACGTIATTALNGIMSDSSVLHSMRELYCLAGMPQCRSCAFRYWCAGDCRAEALAVGGSHCAPSPYCSALRKLIPEMFWLIADGWQGLGTRNHSALPWS